MTRLFFIALAFLMTSTTCKAETELGKRVHIALPHQLGDML